ncbi:glucoamylase family protein [Tellurirhabdus rosea]|uniref:glucoamylase family protein n=1 Tax=Tellurirhabdus rosea TaxID=2674997 RepID=UPI002251A902|nr:glucoamylase family protein [Tellurirhabdus rosea]
MIRAFTLLFLISLNCRAQQPAAPANEYSEYLETVQKATFRYFWDFGHPVSGLAPERTATPNIVTTGGTGFGIMAIVVGAERGWVTRAEAAQRMQKIVGFLEKSDRFHGVWPHWLDGRSGKVVPFSQYDDGGDLVETAFLVNGLLSARAYFTQNTAVEKDVRQRIEKLWREVEWDWHVQNGKLLWHWSPNHGWKMNHPIRGFDETIITYVLALGSPTHAIPPTVYENTYKQSSYYKNGNTYFGYRLPLGMDMGGPLFFTHYSYLSLDPRLMQDDNTYYWTQNLHHTLINRAHCLQPRQAMYGYGPGNWGLTASDDYNFYDAHSPTNDNGTISPTAALSAFPYTPYYSMQVLRNLYLREGSRLFGPYGFYDAYHKNLNWYSNQYLAIDQGPIVVMMENYRSGLIWKLGERTPELWTGLEKMGIRKPVHPTSFYAYAPDFRTGYVDLWKHPDRGAFVLDFAVKGASPVSLNVLDETGKPVRKLIDNQAYAEGMHQLTFQLPQGKYTFELTQGADRQQVRLFLHQGVDTN